MSHELQVSEGRQGELVVTLAREPGNTFTSDMCAELTALLTSPPAGTHVMRLRASGSAFCLGRDRPGDDVASLRPEAEALVAVNRALLRSPLVTVAEVQGDAAGFGVGLAVLCDVTVAAAHAAFSFPEVTIDLAPSLVLGWLPQIVGRRMAFWLTATGEAVSATRALELGLINAAVPASELVSATDVMVGDLMAHRPSVHSAIKLNLNTLPELSFEQANDLALERLIIGSLGRRRG